MSVLGGEVLLVMGVEVCLGWPSLGNPADVDGGWSQLVWSAPLLTDVRRPDFLGSMSVGQCGAVAAGLGLVLGCSIKFIVLFIVQCQSDVVA